MKTILAIAVLLAACDNLAPATGGPDPIADSMMYGGGPLRAYQPPPMQPMPTQTYRMPSGRMVNCTTIGTVTNCF